MRRLRLISHVTHHVHIKHVFFHYVVFLVFITLQFMPVGYCRFGNFRENFIFANSIKRHISDVKNSRLGQDLPISKNDRVILPFREGFIFTKLREVSRK